MISFSYFFFRIFCWIKFKMGIIASLFSKPEESIENGRASSSLPRSSSSSASSSSSPPPSHYPYAPVKQSTSYPPPSTSSPPPSFGPSPSRASLKTEQNNQVSYTPHTHPPSTPTYPPRSPSVYPPVTPPPSRASLKTEQYNNVSYTPYTTLPPPTTNPSRSPSASLRTEQDDYASYIRSSSIPAKPHYTSVYPNSPSSSASASQKTATSQHPLSPYSPSPLPRNALENDNRIKERSPARSFSAPPPTRPIPPPSLPLLPLPPPPSPGQIWLYPKDIKFTQDTISTHFTNGTPVEVVVQVMKKYPENLKELPQIRVMLLLDRHHWSLDNRRLYVHLSCAPYTPLLCILEPHTAANVEELTTKKKSVDGGLPRLGHY